MNIIRDLNLFRVRQNMIENQWDKATRNTNHKVYYIMHSPRMTKSIIFQKS